MAMGFVTALGIARRGFDAWARQPHNKRWWKRIDGTPIQNDLIVCIAKEFAGYTGAREWPDGRLSADDDGALSIALAVDPKSNRLIVRFEHPTEWIGLDSDSLRNLIDLLDEKHGQMMTAR